MTTPRSEDNSPDHYYCYVGRRSCRVTFRIEILFAALGFSGGIAAALLNRLVGAAGKPEKRDQQNSAANLSYHFMSSCLKKASLFRRRLFRSRFLVFFRNSLGFLLRDRIFFLLRHGLDFLLGFRLRFLHGRRLLLRLLLRKGGCHPNL